MKYKLLPTLLDQVHDQVESALNTARKAMHHPTDKGDASESVWIELFNKYLPRRYVASKAHAVDSNGDVSEQIDILIHDRQYSPLVFSFNDTLYVPAEGVYAAFEVKQEASNRTVSYAQNKAASVRRLYRTSIPVPTLDGVRPAKEPGHIIAGLLTLSSEWKPPMGESLVENLTANLEAGCIDIGCIADAGWFCRNEHEFEMNLVPRAATRFLFELIARLQELGTVPMLDIRAYAHHIP